MPQRWTPLSVALSAVAVAGVFVGVAMVLIGLPEATPTQSVLLELSSLPLSASVGAGVVLLRRRAGRPGGPRSRVALSGSAAAVAFGLVLVGWAYAVGPRGLVHTGQTLVWLGLVVALLVMLRRQPRQRTTRFSLLDEAEDDDSGDPADPDRTPSL